jgi:hypothetical protein
VNPGMTIGMKTGKVTGADPDLITDIRKISKFVTYRIIFS